MNIEINSHITSEIIFDNELYSLIDKLKLYDKVYIVSDSKLEYVCKFIQEHIPIAFTLYIKADEDIKTLDTCIDICDKLLQHNANRKDLLLCIGGGIVCDIAAFAGSIYKRKMNFALVPTSLLAQLDASIGGKNGVNFKSFKNILGTINQPDFTYICPSLLKSLDMSFLQDGMAELIKAFIIDNSSNKYEEAIRLCSNIHKSQKIDKYIEELATLIEYAVSVKINIVNQDPYEQNLRAVLNLGHSFAHAIEWKSKGKISHGKAVAKGLYLAAKCSEAIGICNKYYPNNQGLSSKIKEDLEACGFNLELDYPLEELKLAMSKDKKNEGDLLKFVLIKDIGAVVLKKLNISELIERLKNNL